MNREPATLQFERGGFKAESVILDVSGERQEIADDYVWIVAGGAPPNEFLRKVGIGFGMQDTTQKASQESKQAKVERKQLAGVGAP